TSVAALFTASCSASEEPEQIPTSRTTLTLALHAEVGERLADFEGALANLEAAVPPPDADGWSDSTEAAAVLTMREHWRQARVAYQKIWPFVAVLHPAEEAELDLLLDVYLNEPSDEFVGMHAIERILWADAIDAAVLATEDLLDGAPKARFPNDAASARYFRDDLVGGARSAAKRMATRHQSEGLGPELALIGMAKMTEKLLKKLAPPLGLYESRYSRHTAAELLANIDGLESAWRVLEPLGDTAATSAVNAGLGRLRTILAGVEHLPTVPENWNPSIVEPPVGVGDYQGLWTALRAEVDLVEGSLTWGLMRALTAAEALPAEPAPDGLTLFSGDPGFPVIEGVDEQWLVIFDRGQREFDATFTAQDGLGPVYIEPSCSTCHFDSAEEKRIAVQKMTVLENGSPSADQSSLTYGRTVRPRLAGGGLTAVVPGVAMLVADRASPGLFGRGWMEAVDDDEIERIAVEQSMRSDGIAGIVNRVAYASEANSETPFHSYQAGDLGLIGRFGLKAQIATVDDFIAGAYLTDMSITSPLRPDELPNPDGLTDDERPGIDLGLDRLNNVADWTRLIAIPTRESGDPRGETLFTESGCAVCHVPSMKTRNDYPIAQMAGTDAHIYSDLLLHDMGPDATDGVIESDASATHWRTAPLIALSRMANFLHDGSAATIQDAIEGHGGEAEPSVAAWLALDDSEQAALLDFVSSL
ncbi:MAG: hypothetical protein ACI9OJ_005509, partial [Myxococcota bacterium]